ncbi:MAG: peptide chain release factor 1 [Nitrospirae bacterium]|nr:MAG: peptide chain release factor 1 [Nitrospirota bacterium]
MLEYSHQKEEAKENEWYAQWEGIANRYETLTHQLADPAVLNQPALLRSLTKERAELEAPAQLFYRYRTLCAEIAKTQRLLDDPHLDKDLETLAKEELRSLRQQCREVTDQAIALLHPQRAEDEKNTFVEIRAGTGGEEAALFAADLLRMYVKYAEKKGLHVEIVEMHETGIGGIKEAILLIEGKGAYGHFRYESGVHRVQRVPTTEASGRIHTSTATVAVMPEVEEVEVQIDPKDLRIDTFCSSGAGGQSVNTTYSAVRITHIPTGFVVTCQDERSQLKNRNKAMRTLRSRIAEAERAKQEASIAEHRRAQVGTGERSEKIRTYNYPQNRVTDHRIGLTLHKLDAVLNGNLDELIAALKAASEVDLGSHSSGSKSL